MMAKRTTAVYLKHPCAHQSALRNFLKHAFTCQRPQLYIDQVPRRCMHKPLSYRRNGQTDRRTDVISALYTVPLNYNFIFTRVYTRGTTTNLHPLPVTCLRGPRFLVAWNIHASCRNTRGITRYVEEHGTYKFTRVLFNLRISRVIPQLYKQQA